MVEFLVFLVTGFALALAAWYLFDALPGPDIRFHRRTLREYGTLHSGVAFALAGPVITLDKIFSRPTGALTLVGGVLLSVLWSLALGMTAIGAILSF